MYDKLTSKKIITFYAKKCLSKPIYSILFYLITSLFCALGALWERSGSVVECLTQDGGAAGSSLTALWSVSKTHLS